MHILVNLAQNIAFFIPPAAGLLVFCPTTFVQNLPSKFGNCLALKSDQIPTFLWICPEVDTYIASPRNLVLN